MSKTKANAVSLKINEQSLIKNLSRAFSNAFSVVMELLQNGRRAGATQIIIKTECVDGLHNLSVWDNGSGVENFQALLTVAESGWDEAIVRSEHAYGMGFLSALFAAKKVICYSKGRKLVLDTASMLSMNDAHVEDSNELESGTRVDLFGLATDVTENLVKKLRGFGVSIILNGVEVKRELALDNGDVWLDTKMGKLCINFHDLCGGNSRFGYTWQMFLQGFPVRSYGSMPDVILHLDSSKYFGRMPDRDNLIDGDQVEKEFIALVSELSEEWVVNRLSIMDEADFLGRHGGYVVQNMPHLMNKLGRIPRQNLMSIEHLSLHSDMYSEGISEQSVSFADVASGEILLFAANPNKSEDEWNLLGFQFIFNCENAYILDQDLPAGHWAESFVIDLDNMSEFTLDVSNKGKSAQIRGDYISSNVVLCDEVKISFKGKEVVIKDAAVYDYNAVLVPSGASDWCGGDVAEIMANYDSDYSFDEASHSSDAEAINRAIRLLRASDFSTAIRDAITHRDVDSVEGISGKHYLVQFSEEMKSGYKRDGNVNVVEFGDVLKELGFDVSPEQIRKAVSNLTFEKSSKS